MKQLISKLRFQNLDFKTTEEGRQKTACSNYNSTNLNRFQKTTAKMLAMKTENTSPAWGGYKEFFHYIHSMNFVRTNDGAFLSLLIIVIINEDRNIDKNVRKPAPTLPSAPFFPGSA